MNIHKCLESHLFVVVDDNRERHGAQHPARGAGASGVPRVLRAAHAARRQRARQAQRSLHMSREGEEQVPL